MTADQRKALKGRNLDAEIEEKLAMIREGEVQVEYLEQECERLGIVVVQRRMDMNVLDQQAEGFSAAVHMFGRYYQHEISIGQHQGKSVGALLVKYLNRERNLMVGRGWRFSLARWLVRSVIDDRVVILDKPRRKESQIEEVDNG
jgi:hypothetical protein